MDQKPSQSSDTPQAPTPPVAPVEHPTDAPAAPVSSEHHDGTPPPPPAPRSTDSASPAAGAGNSASGQPTVTPPPGSPSQPQDVHPHSNKAMLLAVGTLVIVLIGAGIVTMMNSASPEPGTNAPVVTQPTEAPPLTAAPTVLPSPSSALEEVEAVNVTENDSDLQDAEKDLQSL